jgi:2-keto-4-pentenoate hydratase
MTTMTEANIRLGAVLAQAENRQSSLGVSQLENAGLLPSSIETGMAVQAIAAASIGKEVAGWKLGINNGRAIAAPLLDLYDMKTETSFEIPKPGAVAIEIEVCFVLSDDLPAPGTGREYTVEDVLPHVASVHLGAELCSYRLVEENKAPLPLFLADRLGNHSFVLGPEIDIALAQRLTNEDPTLAALVVEGDGEVLFAATPKHPQSNPLTPLVAYANLPIDHLGGLKRGQVVTTGSLCGLIRLSRQSVVKARWGDLPEMTIRLPV